MLVDTEPTSSKKKKNARVTNISTVTLRLCAEILMFCNNGWFVAYLPTSKEKQDGDAMLFYCWPIVADVGPTIKQHQPNGSCLLGRPIKLKYWRHSSQMLRVNPLVVYQAIHPFFLLVHHSNLDKAGIVYGLINQWLRSACNDIKSTWVFSWSW